MHDLKPFPELQAPVFEKVNLFFLLNKGVGRPASQEMQGLTGQSSWAGLGWDHFSTKNKTWCKLGYQ